MTLRKRKASYQPGRTNTKRQTVTAFVDLLGLTSPLLKLDDIMLKSLNQEQATQFVVDSIGTIRSFRRTFEEAYSTIESVPPPADLTAKGRAAWDKSRAEETRLQWFSDCALINHVINPKNVLGSYRETLLLFVGLSFCTLAMASKGRLFRGGIEMGLAIDNGDEEVLGSGLAHAYNLEKNIAHYPRICIGPQFGTFLRSGESPVELAAIGVPPHEVTAIHSAVHLIRQLIVVDPDGIPRLDFLAPVITKALAKRPKSSLLDQCREAIRKEIQALEPARDADKYKKYSWMHHALTHPRVEAPL